MKTIGSPHEASERAHRAMVGPRRQIEHLQGGRLKEAHQGGQRRVDSDATQRLPGRSVGVLRMVHRPRQGRRSNGSIPRRSRGRIWLCIGPGIFLSDPPQIN